MTLEEFEALKPGDLVRHMSGGDGVYIVTASYGDRVTAVRSIDMTNPQEWRRLTKMCPSCGVKDEQEEPSFP